ncbi:hypothetical protein KBC40_02685 [Patescibacteria group bacterium]|nr:hypothetical protein [Patescibacteria group bacterium]
MPVFSLKNFFGSKPKQPKKNHFSVVKKSPQNNISKVDDRKRRLFLKSLGVIGLGAIGATVFPKKTSALVMGGTPATSVVGVKDASNVRISPATEASLTSVKNNTDTLVTNSNKFTFSGSNLLVESSGGSDVVGVKDSSDNRIDPVSEDAVIMLRRIVKLLESNATVDVANRQRMTVDAWGASVPSGTGNITGCVRVALGTDSTVGTVTSVTNVVSIGSYAAAQMYGDVAHDVYANSIRRNLTFS